MGLASIGLKPRGSARSAKEFYTTAEMSSLFFLV